jgi:hypothetical protein
MLRLLKRIIVLNLMLVGAAKLASRVLPDTRDTTADEFELTSILDESTFASVATCLVGGKATTLYGASGIDLREAVLSDSGGTLNVVTGFGATEIRVPDAWNIVIENTAFAGSIENKTSSDDLSGSTLRISGYTAFGLLSITN